MTVKELKKLLEKAEDDQEVVGVSASGLNWKLTTANLDSKKLRIRVK